MNYHLNTLILQEIDDCDNEAISKLRLVSPEFYDFYANILPYNEPQDWSALQGSSPVLFLFRRFIERHRDNLLRSSLPLMTDWIIGETLYRFRLIKEVLELRGLIRNPNHAFEFESEFLYPLIAQYEDYALAHEEIILKQDCQESLCKLIESFIRVKPRDPRVKSLIRECIRVCPRTSFNRYFDKNTLAHSDLDLLDFLTVVKLIYTPMQMNVFARELYLDYERPDLALCIANSNSKKYGGRLPRGCWSPILATKAEPFLNFCSETGIRFEYWMNESAFLGLLLRLHDYSPSQKALTSKIISNCDENFKTIIDNAKEVDLNQEL